MHFIPKIVAALLCILLAASPAGSGSMTLLGVGKAGTGAAPPLALDGSASINSSTTPQTIALTTTGGSGVIVVAIITNGNISTVTASGLTFTLRGPFVSGTAANVYEYTAPYSVNFSGNITVTMSSNIFTTSTVFGISGAKTSSFFDANGAVPTTATSGNVSISTSNANDFIFATYATGSGSPTAGAGWTQINGSNFQLVEYQIVSATQSGLAATFTSGGPGGGGIIDAIVQGP